MLVLFLLLLSLINNFDSGHGKVYYGECPEVEAFELSTPFNISGLMGTWYEIEMIPNFYERSHKKCNFLEFTMQTSESGLKHLYLIMINKRSRLLCNYYRMFRPRKF